MCMAPSSTSTMYNYTVMACIIDDIRTESIVYIPPERKLLSMQNCKFISSSTMNVYKYVVMACIMYCRTDKSFGERSEPCLVQWIFCLFHRTFTAGSLKIQRSQVNDAKYCGASVRRMHRQTYKNICLSAHVP